jgi:urease accessory protein
VPFLGTPAICLKPMVFPQMMAFGGALGVTGLPLLGVETCLAVSAIAFGGFVGRVATLPYESPQSSR